MTMRSRPGLCAGVALIALVAGPASAAESPDIEARMSAIESRMAALTGELEATRAENASLRSELAETRAKASPPPTVQTAAAPADGFKVGGTTIKIGGFLKTVATFSRWDDGDVAGNSLGRDFYLPQAIPVGGTRESTDSDFSAKQTRLWLNLSTDVSGRTLKGYLETDFQTSPGTQGSERTTNGYNLALRRAWVQFDNLLVGQDWSTFQYVGALPESTDFVGPTEGTVFVRQPLVRYTAKLTPALALSVSAENAESATISSTSPTLSENDDDRMPDFVARLAYTAPFGELSLAGLFRQLSVDNGTISDKTGAWGVSAAGKIMFGPDKRHDFRFMATYGDGIGRYVGLNFAPDAVYDGLPGSTLETVKTFAALAALKLGWTPMLRSTFMAGYQNASYPSPAPLTANDKAWSLAANLFWSPVKALDLGVEYRHGERELLNGLAGQLNRLEFAAKYNF